MNGLGNINSLNAVGSLMELDSPVKLEKEQDSFKEVLEQAVNTGDDEAMKEACDELESYMLSMMLKQVKSSLLPEKEDRLIGEGDYVKMFSDTMINAVSEQVVKAGGMGLSNQLYEQMKKDSSLVKAASKVEEAKIGVDR